MLTVRVWIVSFVLITATICFSHAKAPTKYKCGDHVCKKIISIGRTSIKYNAIESHMVSFPPNVDVRVLAKADNIWHIEVQGRQGWAPKNLLREIKMHVKSDQLIEVNAAVEEALLVEKQTEELQAMELNDTKVVAEIVAVEKPVDEKITELKPVEGKPIELKPVEEKPIEQKPVDEKTTDQKPVEEKPIEQKPVDEKPTEQEVVEAKPIEQKPVDEKPTEPKPVDEKPTEPKPIEQNLFEEKPIEQKTVEENPIEREPVDEKPTDSKPVEEKPIEQKSVEEKPSAEEPPPPTEANAGITAASLVDALDVEEDREEVQLDEDDLLAMDDEKKLVDEPLFIKKDVYKVGEEDADVKLELIGTENNINTVDSLKVGITETDTVTNSGQLNVQTQPTEDTKMNTSADENVNNSANTNKDAPITSPQEQQKDSVEAVTPSAPIETVSSEVKQEPVETVASIHNIQPSFAAHKTVIDGTTLPDFENDSMLTPVESIDGKQTVSEALKTATILPTLNVQPDDSRATETPKIETEQFTATLDTKPSDSYDSITTDATFYEYEYYSSASTQDETIASSIDSTAAIQGMVEALQSPVATIPPHDENGEEIQDPVTPINEVQQPETPIPHEYFEEQSTEASVETPVESPEKQQNEPTAIPLQAEALPEPFDSDSKSLLSDSKTEDALNANTQSESASPTDDIFSANYVPKVDSVDSVDSVAPNSVDDESNWYDGILIGFESIYGSIAPVFNFGGGSSESNSEDVIDSVASSGNVVDASKTETAAVDGYCEKLEGNSCPQTASNSYYEALPQVNYNKYVNQFLNKVVEMASLVMCLSIAGACIVLLLFGQQCLSNNQRESGFIAKLNAIERKLHTTEKECDIVKAELQETRKQYVSIKKKTFGTDDMIQQCEREKAELRAQLEALEKELETSVEAGLELNKMVSDLLNNQSGSDSIISSVEELQKQLNEQEATTVYINNLLAEKSRENSELQILLSESNNKFGTEIDSLLKENDELKAERRTIENELKETIDQLQVELGRDLDEKAAALDSKTAEFNELSRKYDEIVSRWQISMARAEAYEASISKLKELNGKDDIKTVIEITNSNAKLLAIQKENESLKEKLDADAYSQSRLREQISSLTEEISRLRTEFNQNEKDKLEAQTRLDVLSNYFKDKESQLQKELSVKEALFMKQQGESTSTVERVRSLQEEIHGLRSQNDELRAEIEAQSAAHKAQINAAEGRAHDSWLAAKQTERRLEEAKSEATVLRKRLTNISFNATAGDSSLPPQINSVDGLLPAGLNAPSPIHMEPSASPPLMNLPPPPFIPLPFGVNAPMNVPFMPLPPLVPIPNEMRGRLLSPPPPDHRYAPNDYGSDRERYDRNRYSPEDSRYGDYPTDMYETEADYSPPRSPEPYRRDRNYRNYSPSPPPPPSNGGRKKSTASKGALSSGSTESATSHKKRPGARV